jgi:N-formylglutamate amidohydrolase
VHALQIEINRALYLDETSLRPTANFARLQRDLTALIQRLFAGMPPLIERRAAAE